MITCKIKDTFPFFLDLVVEQVGNRIRWETGYPVRIGKYRRRRLTGTPFIIMTLYELIVRRVNFLRYGESYGEFGDAQGWFDMFYKFSNGFNEK